jgi:hypothetical protein
VVVAKDTQKDEKEKSLIDSWEIKEPGRKDKAKSNRMLYEARRKKAAKEQLTDEEIKLLEENKAEKYAPEDPNKKGGAGGKGAPAKGQPPAAAKKPPAATAGKKDGKDQAKPEEVKKEIVFPKASEHNMAELKAFLRHMEKPRMSVEELHEGVKPRVRSEAEFKEIFETCLMTKEDALSHLDKFSKRREDFKKQRDQIYEQKLKGYHEYLEIAKKQFEEIKEELSHLNGDLVKRKENETALVTVLSNDLVTEPLLKDAIAKAKEQHVDDRLIYAAEKYLKNLHIKNSCTLLKEKLDAFDEAGVKAQKEYIETHKIELEEDLALQMEDFFINIETNPNYIQEKLAELKKLPKGKGGKK